MWPLVAGGKGVLFLGVKAVKVRGVVGTLHRGDKRRHGYGKKRMWRSIRTHTHREKHTHMHTHTHTEKNVHTHAHTCSKVIPVSAAEERVLHDGSIVQPTLRLHQESLNQVPRLRRNVSFRREVEACLREEMWTKTQSATCIS